jgi:hypothetical protein
MITVGKAHEPVERSVDVGDAAHLQRQRKRPFDPRRDAYYH